MSTRIDARQVRAGMTVLVYGVPGEWTTLSRHPKAGYWWLHRWVGGKWETTEAHYTAMTQILRMPGE